MGKLGRSFGRLLAASALSNLADGVFPVAEIWGLRPTFAVAALLHVPLLLGFLVITDEQIEAADTVTTT